MTDSNTATVVLFKPSGKYYTSESWDIPEGAYGPYDMRFSRDFRQIDGTGMVLVPSDSEFDGDENWGFPCLLDGPPR